jgi:hypothetical protein
MPPEFTDTDVELLSAYLDGMLTDSERAALEQRLAIDPALRRELAALRQTIDLIQALPALKAPRSFTLSPEMLTLPEPQTAEPSPALNLKKVIVMPVAPPRRASRRNTWQPAVFAAAAVFVVAIGFALMFTMTGNAPMAPQGAELAFQPTQTPVPPFSNMVTGLEEPSEPPATLLDGVPAENPPQPLTQPSQSEAGAELKLSPTFPATATADEAENEFAVPVDESQAFDVRRTEDTDIIGGMGGGGFQSSGEDFVEPGFEDSVIAPESANMQPMPNATRVTVNTDPNAPGFSVRPAGDTETDTADTSAAGTEPMIGGVPTQVVTDGLFTAPAPVMQQELETSAGNTAETSTSTGGESTTAVDGQAQTALVTFWQQFIETLLRLLTTGTQP